MLVTGIGGSEHVVGIRTNDMAAVDWLRARLASTLVDDAEALPNISVRIGSRRGRVRDAHLVYRRGFFVKRTTSFEEAMEAAIAQLHTFSPPAPGLTPLNARALIRDGQAVVVSDNFAMTLDTHHREVARRGFTMTSHVPLLVDAAGGHALVPMAPDADVPRYQSTPIAGLIVLAPTVEASPAVRLSHVTALIAGRGEPLQSAHVRALAALDARLPVVRLEDMQPAMLLETLTRP